MVSCGLKTVCALALGASLGSSIAQAGWPDERVAGVFLVHADHSLADQTTVLGELPQLQHDVCSKLGLPAPREPIHVFVFAKKETYLAYLAQHFPKAPGRRAIYLKGRGPGMVFAYVSEELPTDLRHECTHALLHAVLLDLPLWLDEGLAEYFEVSPKERRLGSSHFSVVKAMAEVGQTPRLEALETIADLKNMGREEYRDAWAWTHFLLEGPPEGATLLREHLTELREKRDPGLLSERLRRKTPQLERSLAQHILSLAK